MESYLPITRSPQTCHAKLKTQNQQAPDATSFFPVGGMPTASVYLKDFSEKSDAVALQQIKERGALPMIGSWWYPSGNRPLQQYLGFTAGRWLWLPEHKADSLIAKFKEAGGTVREIDVWAESPVGLSPPGLSASSSACRAVNHYRDNAITYKAQRDKNARELEAGERQQLLTCRCAAMLLRSMQNSNKELADAKVENDALRDDVAAGRRRLHIKAVCRSQWSHHNASGAG